MSYVACTGLLREPKLARSYYGSTAILACGIDTLRSCSPFFSPCHSTKLPGFEICRTVSVVASLPWEKPSAGITKSVVTAWKLTLFGGRRRGRLVCFVGDEVGRGEERNVATSVAVLHQAKVPMEEAHHSCRSPGKARRAISDGSP